MIGRPASMLLMLAGCHVLCSTVLLRCRRRHHLDLFGQLCSVKPQHQLVSSLLTQFGCLSLLLASLLTLSLQTGLSIPPLSLLLTGLPLATQSRHQMAKAGGWGDALVILSFSPYCSTL